MFWRFWNIMFSRLYMVYMTTYSNRRELWFIPRPCRNIINNNNNSIYLFSIHKSDATRWLLRRSGGKMINTAHNITASVIHVYFVVPAHHTDVMRCTTRSHHCLRWRSRFDDHRVVSGTYPPIITPRASPKFLT